MTTNRKPTAKQTAALAALANGGDTRGALAAADVKGGPDNENAFLRRLLDAGHITITITDQGRAAADA